MIKFQEIINNLKLWRLWIVIVALFLPFLDKFLCFGPPWPSWSITIICATLSVLLAIVLSLAIAYNWYYKIKKYGRYLIVLGTVFILLFGYIYISLNCRYVRIFYRDREVIGSEYIDNNMKEFVASNPSKYSPEELFKQFHEVEKIWSQDSLVKNRMRLLSSWCFWWFGIGLLVSGTIIIQQNWKDRIYNVAYEPSRPEKKSSQNTDVKEVILLVHGIRTHGEWQSMVQNILEEKIPEIHVWPLKYRFLNAFYFWLPFWTRQKSIGEVLWRINFTKWCYPNARLSVIAHSYGTYAIGMILKDNPEIILHKLVLCGAVLPCDFRWDQIAGQITTEVINECGTKDIWPVLAESFSWGYGASGRFGFGTPGIYDRFHNKKHSDYFKKQFVEKFWLTWFENGFRRDGIKPHKGAYWWSLLTVVKIRWLIFLVPLLYMFGWLFLWFIR